MEYQQLEANRKGDISEGYVVCLAQVKGAEVFKNVGCTGKIDTVLLVEGRFIPIDVKTASWGSNGVDAGMKWHSSDAYKVPKSIYPVLVIPKTGTDISGWECRWINTRIPDGLTSFWDKHYTTPHTNETTYPSN